MIPSVAAADAPVASRPGADAWRRFRANRLALVGLALVAVMILVALFAPLIARQDPLAVDVAARLEPPSSAHWFGTDPLGRDLFSRVVWGARTSLGVALATVAISVVVGVVVGLAAGYRGGRTDGVLMRIADVFLAFPYLIAAIALLTVLGRSTATVVLVLSLFGWMSVARVQRAAAMSVRHADHVLAARASGVTERRIAVRHVLPNSIQPVIAIVTTFIATAILAESALSFLGVGITEPQPAWGLMISRGSSLLLSAPYVLLFPGGALFLTVMGFVLVGDGVQDAFDPRAR